MKKRNNIKEIMTQDKILGFTAEKIVSLTTSILKDLLEPIDSPTELCAGFLCIKRGPALKDTLVLKEIGLIKDELIKKEKRYCAYLKCFNILLNPNSKGIFGAIPVKHLVISFSSYCNNRIVETILEELLVPNLIIKLGWESKKKLATKRLKQLGIS